MRTDRDRRSDIGDAAENQRDVNRDVGRLGRAGGRPDISGRTGRRYVVARQGVAHLRRVAPLLGGVGGRHVDRSRIRGEVLLAAPEVLAAARLLLATLN